jgi:hypothetical protein
MAATYNKFTNFVYAFGQGQINLSTTGHTFSVMLTNTLPTSTMKTSTDITEISTGNGYAHLGSTCQITSYTVSSASSTGVLTVLGPSAGVVFTASGGSIGPFRYAALLDQSTAYGGNPQLVSWYDYGSAVTLATTESFTLTFDASSGILQLA